MSGSWRHIPFDGRPPEYLDIQAGVWINDDNYEIRIARLKKTGKWGWMQHVYRSTEKTFVFDSAEAAIVAFKMMRES